MDDEGEGDVKQEEPERKPKKEWIDNDVFTTGEKASLPPEEEQFFEELITTYLKPLAKDKKREEKIQQELIVRNMSEVCQRIDADAKWPPFSRRYFEMDVLNGDVWLSIKIPVKFVLRVQIKNIPVLDHIMAGRRPGDQSISEPMMLGGLR